MFFRVEFTSYQKKQNEKINDMSN